MRSLWNIHIDKTWNDVLFHQVRGQIFWMFHLKTNNLQTNQTLSLNIRPSVEIHSMHFVFPFCSYRYIVIPISKNTWESEATLLSDFSSFLPLRVESYGPIPWEFFNIKFNLRNLIPLSQSSLLDRGLAEFIFPNATFLQNSDKACFCCKLNPVYNSWLGGIEELEGDREGKYETEAPLLTTEQSYNEILLATYKDEYTFLSCGDTYYDPPNFLALFMPFTNLVWALIFVTIFGWPLILSLIENDFKLKNVLKDFDALFIGWAMILEQSHLRATNYKGRGPLYCYCGCVLLAILVISNAYKGDNIQTLTKSFELVPLTHMSQLIKAGYKTYISKRCTKTAFALFGYEACTGDFDSIANRSRDQYTDKQFKVWQPMDIEVTYTNPYNKTKPNSNQSKVGSFGKCWKRALLGWRSKLVKLEEELLIKHPNAYIYLGQEFIFTERKGWQLKRYGSIKVLKRFWTLVESGVYEKLLNISYKPPIGSPYKPRRLTIHGNIFVQFVFHLFGQLIALLVFVVELRKLVALYFDSVYVTAGFLIRNFLHQSEKTFLLGFKYIFNVRIELKHLRPICTLNKND